MGVTESMDGVWELRGFSVKKYGSEGEYERKEM